MKNQNQEANTIFNKERASSYDERAAKLAPMLDMLQLMTRMILSELPAQAHVLCVGVGTGSELLALAHAFPQWHFTAVDPAAAMLDVCRQRAKESDIISRCTFHEGYLDSLPSSKPFDAATCFLVSHFFVQPEERSNFFRQIAARLRSGAYLVSSDLASDMSTPAYESLFELWLRMLKFSGWPAEQVENLRTVYGRDVALLPPHEVESIIAAGGFESPVLCLQTGLIHAWYSKRTSSQQDS